jgi:hypothetical protein
MEIASGAHPERSVAKSKDSALAMTIIIVFA